MLTWVNPINGFVQWLHNGQLIPGAVNSIYWVLDTGNYQLVVQTGCSVDTSSAMNIVQQSPLYVATLSMTSDTLCCNNHSMPLSNGFPPGGVYSGNAVNNPNIYCNFLSEGQLVFIQYTYIDSLGCKTSDQDSLVIHIPPQVNWTPNPVICNTDPSFILTNGQPPGGSYSGAAVINNMFYPNLAVQGINQVIYTFTDSTGCTRTINGVIYVIICTGVGENYSNEFANISIDQKDLSLSFGIEINSAQIQLNDEIGRILLSRKMEKIKLGASFKLDISFLENGIYFVSLITKSGKCNFKFSMVR
jgi:hypothetical protein